MMVLSMGEFSLLNSTSLNRINNTVFLSHFRSHKIRFTSSPGSLFAFCCKTNSFLSSLQQSQQTPFSFRAVSGERRNGFCVFAVKKGIKGGTELIEMDGVGDDDDDEWVDFDGDGDEDEDESDVGVLLPFGKMKKWLESRPRGFGEGKVYDTSIEDELLELEQSRQAQTANLNKLKNNPVQPGSKKDNQNKKAPEVTPSGIRVRLTNLPKKKNVHRDLKSAFKGVPGMINISAAVSGNKKTKDPICKGFGFVDFKSGKDATRFIETFSRQRISFGRIQKQIKCEMMNSLSHKSNHEKSSDTTSNADEQKGPGSEEDMNADCNTDGSISDSCVETAFDEPDNPDDELDRVKMEDVKENPKSINITEATGADKMKPRKEFISNSNSSKRLEKIRALEKKLLAKGKAQKQIKRKMVNSLSRKSNDAHGSTGRGSEKDINAYSSMDDSNLNSWVESAFDEPDNLEDELDRVKMEDIKENLESVSVAEPKGGDNTKPTKEFTTGSNSSKRLDKIQATEKKLLAKVKAKKVPKLHIPGSAKRLKIKEKAVLSGVLSKYAVKAALASEDEG